MSYQQGESIFVHHYEAGRPGTDNVQLQMSRASDGFFFDFADSTFKAAGHADIDLAMTSAGAGLWRASFTETDLEDMLEFRISNTTSGASEVKLEVVGGYVELLDKAISLHDADIAARITAGVPLNAALEVLDITIEDSGGDPVPGARVRVLNSVLSALVVQGIADSDGQFVVDVPAGTYQLIASQPGVQFANPTEVVVLDTSSGIATVESARAASSFQGDMAAVTGFNFNPTAALNVVSFSTAAGGTVTVAASEVSPNRRTILVRIPTSLGDLVSTTVSVNNGQGASNGIGLVLTRPPRLTSVMAGPGGTVILAGGGFGASLSEVLTVFRVLSGDTGAIGTKRRGANAVTDASITVDFPTYSSVSQIGVTVVRRGLVSSPEVTYVVP